MPPAARRRLLAIVCGCVFAQFLGFNSLTPIGPSVAHDLRLGPDSLGAIFGLSSLVAALLQIPAGIVGDRFGRRPFLVAGMVIMTGALAVRWLVTGPALLAVSQLAVGVCNPMVVASAYAAVGEGYPKTSRVQAIGFLQAAVSVGQAASFLVGGLLGGPIGWRGASLAMALFPALMVVPALFTPEPPRAMATVTMGQEALRVLRFLVTPRAAVLSALAAITLGSGVAAVYLLPFVARGEGLSSAATGLILVPYVVGSVLGSPLTGRLADRFGLFAPHVAWMLLGAAAAAAFAVFGPALPVTIACFGVLGGAVGAGISLTAATAIGLVQRGGAGGLGAGLGGVRTGQAIGPGVGPGLTGLLYARGGLTVAYLGIAGAMLLGAGLAAGVHARRARD